MKYLILYLLLPITLFCQQLTTEQLEVLKLETGSYPELTNKQIQSMGDSIVLRKETAIFSYSPADLKTWCLDNEELSKEQAEDVFGTLPETCYNNFNCPEMWTNKDFENEKVILFDKNIHIAYATKRSDDTKKNVGNNILLLTCPWIKSDGKFALVETFSELYGGMLSIYQNIDGKWILYKQIQLYYT